MRILLVEDNPGDARLVEEFLKEVAGDFMIDVAESLGAGMELLASRAFDVVLLDLGLPDSHGLDTLVRLRARFAHLPVVIMTSVDDEALGVQAVQLGAQDYVPKGSAGGELLRRILMYAIERKRAEEEIRKSLREKEVLLKEIHHRVKNNLQVISSLIALQMQGTKDEAVREMLRDLTDRVRSMALVHERLYQSPDLARIDFAEYVRGLLNYLWRAHGDVAASIRLTHDLSPVLLPVNIAVPCGLILNELVGNALKHAFCGRSGGEVRVSLKGNAEEKIHLCVADNGAGLPANLDWRRTASMGLHLVDLLSGQLGAAVDVNCGEGTRFEIIF